jgi:hypothetical protein
VSVGQRAKKRTARCIYQHRGGWFHFLVLGWKRGFTTHATGYRVATAEGFRELPWGERGRGGVNFQSRKFNSYTSCREASAPKGFHAKTIIIIAILCIY